MSEIRQSEIIYEEGWRQNTPVPVEPPADEKPLDEQPPQQKAPEARPLLTVIRLILCLAAALTLFLLKTMGSGVYDAFIQYYREELQKPLISQGVFDAADVSRLFSESPIAVQSTPDEAAPR